MSDIRTRHYVSCAVFDPSPGHCDCGAMSESEAISTLTAELALVKAERDAALKDAERYRWLRSQSGRITLNTFAIVGEFGKYLDDLMDAAREG